MVSSLLTVGFWRCLNVVLRRPRATHE